MGRLPKFASASRGLFFLLILFMAIFITTGVNALSKDVTDAQKVSPSKFLGINSIEKMRPEGEYEIHVWQGKKWTKVGYLAYDRFLREREIDLSGFFKGNGKAKIKIVQKGGKAAHIDSVLLGGLAPQEIKGISDNLALRKLSKKDLDVMDAYNKTIELTFPNQGDKKLKLTARIEGPIKNGIPFQFPRENLMKEVKAFSSFYTYQLNNENKTQEPKLIFKEFSPTGSGHPSGFSYGWVRHDSENLYVKIDFTPDNTSDGDKDYAKVFVRTDAGIKEFKVSTKETKWGKPYFTYTDKVSYQHKVYEFAIPFKELGIGSGEKKENIQLAFSAYGTAGWGNSQPAIAYDSQNNRYLIAYLKTDREGNNLYGKILNCDGSDFSEEFVISNTFSSQYNPEIAYDSVNRRFLVVFYAYVSGTSYDIYGQLVNADGTLNGSSFVISNAENEQRYPKVAYDSVNQRFLVVWEDYRTDEDNDIYGQLINAIDSSLIGSNFPIAQGNGDQVSPAAVAFDRVNQRYLVAWNDNQSNWNIYGQLVNANGTLYGSSLPISTAGEYRINPSIAYDSTNQRFLVAFAAYNPSTDYDIYAQLINADGSPNGSTVPISQAVSIQSGPTVGFDSINQRYLVVWHDYRGADYDIYGQYISANGTISGSNFAISEAVNNQYNPKVASNSNYANFLVIYETVVPGEITVYDLATALVGPSCEGFTLSISKAGTGSGTVSSSPAGINCGTECSRAFSPGTSVTLTATASAGSTFAGWSGDADCADGQLTMDANKNCIATFNLLAVAAAPQEEIKVKGGGGCFIATAAFGSYLDPHVQVLRSFRDNYLLSNSLGRVLVNIYYQISPPIANFISKHESLRTATRWALTPLIFALEHPTGALMLLLGLIVAPFARRRLPKILPILLIVLLTASPAIALQGHIFEPQVGEDKFVTVQSSSTINQGKFRVGLFLDYADTPVETTTGIGLSNRQFVGTFLAGVGITEALQISISVPYLFDQGGKKIDLTSDIVSWRFGDVNIAAKYRVLKEKEAGLGLALAPFIILNTGQENDWFGNNSFSGGLKLIVDKNLNNKTAIAFNLGYQIKKKEQLTSTQRIEDMILYGLGISHAFTPQLTLIGEIYGYTASNSAFEKYLSPLEGDLTIGYKILPQVQIILGGGGAITKGVGAPEWRILTGIRCGF